MNLLFAIVSLMLGQEKINVCYDEVTIGNEVLYTNYCEEVNTKEYIRDYTSEIILVNYYKIIDNN